MVKYEYTHRGHCPDCGCMMVYNASIDDWQCPMINYGGEHDGRY